MKKRIHDLFDALSPSAAQEARMFSAIETAAAGGAARRSSLPVRRMAALAACLLLVLGGALTYPLWRPFTPGASVDQPAPSAGEEIQTPVFALPAMLAGEAVTWEPIRKSGDAPDDPRSSLYRISAATGDRTALEKDLQVRITGTYADGRKITLGTELVFEGTEAAEEAFMASRSAFEPSAEVGATIAFCALKSETAEKGVTCLVFRCFVESIDQP
ncbi:MAG: hypothetical protein LBJ11_07250 [Oscillospiraceae bacterium]|jgi:hypothetical protein|nr:hypothetical protein [Oscillospiraceae bacterium]